MDFKTVREFHWLTKIVILLTGFVFVLLAIATVAGVLGMSQVSSGMAIYLISCISILMYLFPVILVVIVIWIIASKVKVWIEKYMDAMLAKMDLLASRNNVEESNAKLAVMGSRMEEIEKKVDNISDILEKVAE